MRLLVSDLSQKPAAHVHLRKLQKIARLRRTIGVREDGRKRQPVPPNRNQSIDLNPGVQVLPVQYVSYVPGPYPPFDPPPPPEMPVFWGRSSRLSQI